MLALYAEELISEFIFRNNKYFLLLNASVYESQTAMTLTLYPYANLEQNNNLSLNKPEH